MSTTNKAAIAKLVDRFHTHRDAYVSGKYNETQLRREFIDPMWKALGWDVDNEQGYAEAYKDVIHEDAIKVSADTFTKAPDYCFRIGGVRKFFLEAKKPSVDIKDDPAPAFQLRRYAWSAKLSLSVLTDFEEMAVYDARIRPTNTDRASQARTLLIPYTDYVERWDEIASIFSREAVLKGSFDKYADTARAKRGTAEVDRAFLEEIERWRDELARNIALRNSELTQRELNYAVQATIDRIVFLRICEDRGIEPYMQLMALTNGVHVYRRLFEVFQKADARYNSGLFHFSRERGRPGTPDALTATLEIDDKPLREIIQSLYYPVSPYEFSVLSADILGQVYEQFLGKIIRLTAGHRAVVEEKPEVRKAGGVYYTPTYIVQYLVRETIGKLVEGKSLKEVAGIGSRSSGPLRIVDPACGSGSFLLGAYQYLLDWHRDAYVADGAEKSAKGKTPVLYQAAGGDWRLTTVERKRILLAHIFGVDIDEQAVEVTKLSLLLKVLEGESDQTLTAQLRLFHDRVLPDLDGNIKSGNSLIGSGFYEEQQMDLLAGEDRRRVNVFDWKAEFPHAFAANGCGFDVVIGNPPYVRIQTLMEWYPEEAGYYRDEFRSGSDGNFDIYVLFMERGLSLLSERGRLGFIVPNKFFNAKYGAPLRGIVGAGGHLSHLVHFGDSQVFDGVSTYTCLVTLTKNPSPFFTLDRVKNLDAWRSIGAAERGKFAASKVTADEWNFAVGSDAPLIERLRRMPTTLGDVAERVFVGLQTGADKVFVVPASTKMERAVLRPFLTSDGIPAYGFPRINHKILFPYRIENGKAVLIPLTEFRSTCPRAWAHLKENEEALRRRDNGQWDNERWYGFSRSQNLTQMDGPKLIIQVLSIEPRLIYDDRNLYMTGGGSGPFYGIRVKPGNGDLLFWLGLLNSSLFGRIIAAQITPMRGGYIKYSRQYIERAPVPVIDLTKRPTRNLHDRVVTGVKQILQLQQQIGRSKMAYETTGIARQISSAAAGIDSNVFELYGLTASEVSVLNRSLE